MMRHVQLSKTIIFYLIIFLGNFYLINFFYGCSWSSSSSLMTLGHTFLLFQSLCNFSWFQVILYELKTTKGQGRCAGAKRISCYDIWDCSTIFGALWSIWLRKRSGYDGKPSCYDFGGALEQNCIYWGIVLRFLGIRARF